MRNLKVGLVASVISGLVAGQVVSAQRAPTGKMPAQSSTSTSTSMSTSQQAVLKDIEATVGFVPQFFRSLPEAMLPSFWSAMKNFEMATTALDSKTKELIGLAVSAQIPCNYCVQFHTEAARQHGATDKEIKEAVGMAAMTRMGSTLLNGMQTDMAQFRKDLQRMMKAGNGKKSTQASR